MRAIAFKLLNSHKLYMVEKITKKVIFSFPLSNGFFLKYSLSQPLFSPFPDH